MHLGYELSRRDDLEAVMYMLVFMRKTTLPWHNPNYFKGEWKSTIQKYGLSSFAFPLRKSFHIH